VGWLVAANANGSIGRFSAATNPLVRGWRMAGFEWDPNKEERNIRERRIDFTTASRIWDGLVIERIDERRDYGEQRTITIGEIDGRLMVVVSTWRGTARHIISVRKANLREKRRLEAEIRRRRRQAEGGLDGI
jgi:uncharacterized DUF497 family protein